MMWFSSSLLFVALLGKCLPAPIPNPPEAKKPRPDPDPKCVVQTSAFKGTTSPCEGDLQKLSELETQVVPRGQGFGAENFAQLLMFRCGILDEQINKENFHICVTHRSSLGSGWISNRPSIYQGGSYKPACKIPALPGLPDLPAPTHPPRKGPKSLLKDGSVTIWRQQGVFVPLGTAMCPEHYRFVKALQSKTADIEDNVDEEARADDEASTSNQDRSGASARDLRPNAPHVTPESPLMQRTWTQTLRRVSSEDVCSVQSSQSSVYSASRDSAQTSPDSQPIRTTLTRADQQCAVVKGAIRQLATALDIPQKSVNFPRKEQFLALAASTQKKRVCLASNIVGVVMEAFAPDAPHELFRRIAKKHAGDLWDKENSDKFGELIEAVVDLYRKAPSRQARLQTLGLIAPMLRYLELQKYIPGITLYAYKEARRYAIMAKAGMKMPATDNTKERYNRAKVETFISFITSSHIVTDMPFGHVTVRLSSGLKMELPNLVRTTVNQRIIEMYKQYLKDTGKTNLQLSDSTYWRILKACKAITRKSLLGLDYYTYDGIEGIASLIGLAQKLQAVDGDGDWSNNVIRTLKDLKVFFKTDYKTHIQESSQFADYSRWYALSDPSDPTQQVEKPGRLEYMRRCAQCIAMEDMFEGFANRIATVTWPTTQKKNEATFVFESAKSGILEWQKHIVRSVNQNLAKEEILGNLGKNDVWILMDWAMKFLPKQGIESQSDWYGKKGISWHISVAYIRDPVKNEFSVRTYVHIFEAVAQDPETVIAIIEDVIKRIKSELPELENVYLRSDNAICYHSGPTLVAIPLLAEKLQVKIKRYDFSEPQSGKGACDRATSIIKRHVNIYVDENHKCTTPDEFFVCASSGTGVNSATFIHVRLHTLAGRGNKGAIDRITHFHNFEYTGRKLRGWNAYKIGSGKELAVTTRGEPLPSLMVSKTSTHGTLHTSDLLATREYWTTLKAMPVTLPEEPVPVPANEAWVPDESDEVCDVAPKQATDDPDHNEGRHQKRLYACEEEGCTKVYTRYYNWFKHVSVGKHHYQKERQSLRDFSIKTYADKIAASDVIRSLPAVTDAVDSERDAEVDPDGTPKLPLGWALKVRRDARAFTKNQIDYLARKFDEGAASGIKHTPQQVAEDMRVQFANKDDWLTPTQIQGWFSRYAKKRERHGGLEGQASAQEGPGQRGRGTARGRGSGRGGGRGRVGERGETGDARGMATSGAAAANAPEPVAIDQEDMDDFIASNAHDIDAQIEGVIGENMERD